MSCERRVITSAMFHMKNKRNIQDFCLQMRILLIRTKHSQNVLCCGKFFLRIMDIETLIFDIMVISLISINR